MKLFLLLYFGQVWIEYLSDAIGLFVFSDALHGLDGLAVALAQWNGCWQNGGW